VPIIRVTLPGNIRSKKNSKRLISIPIKGQHGKTRPMALSSTAYLLWEKAAREAVREQLFYANLSDSEFPFGCPVSVKAVAYCKGVLPDLSGALESVGDCLQGVIWKDDKQIVSWDGSRVYRDKEYQRTEIEVMYE